MSPRGYEFRVSQAANRFMPAWIAAGLALGGIAWLSGSPGLAAIA